MKNENKLLECLRKNSRMKLSAMSKKTKIPISTLYDMLKKTDKIVKNTCLLDFRKLGYAIRANIVLKVGSEQREAMKEFLLKSEHLNSLYRINNGYDFMAEVVCTHLNEMEDFLEKMDSKFKIEERNVYYIINDVERESFLTKSFF